MGFIKKSFFYKIPRRIYHFITNFITYIHFIADFLNFKKSHKITGKRFLLRWKDRYPCLRDRTSTLSFDTHYIYHTAWAARVLAKEKPAMHYDISSSLMFVAIASAIVPIKYFDYRPAEINLSGLTSGKADLLQLPFENLSISSLSCMHVIEHVGLGRYGEEIKPDGDLTAISELKRVISHNGIILFVVPIAGKPKIMFNAHRIYSYDQIISYFNNFELVEFSLIPDDADKRGMIENAGKEDADKQEYGCGCFYFRKIK